MQNASRAYKESMSYPVRNRAYIKVTIGIVNSEAQSNVTVSDSRNDLVYFSDTKQLFIGGGVKNIYATSEQDFSKVDGSMYFLPKDKKNVKYNNGIVTNDILGTIYINFGGKTGFDIKGLTIDFGDCYPVDFTIENDNGIYSYNDNDKRYWTTEEVFEGTSFFIVRPSRMVNGQGRLRIYSFSCGITNTFTNDEVKSFSFKEFVSPITETIPSKDLSLTVDNQNLYYSPDNPDSALAYMDVGQELRFSFGYDVTGNEDIEWLPETVTYLKSWSATDTEAKFTATDRMAYMNEIYYKGIFPTYHPAHPYGVSLYALAESVFNDMGETNYFIDPYLKGVFVQNPIPLVTHAEALQIIANAGHCSLREDRNGRVCIQSQFVPDMTAICNGEMEYSHVSSIIGDEKKEGYAIASNDFSVVDGSLRFLSKGQEFLNTGYVSEQIADSDGNFTENPQITINLAASFVAFGLMIKFRNIAPAEFKITTYLEEVKVYEETVLNPDIDYFDNSQLELFDKMVITFTKGYPNSRVVVDNVKMGDITDYRLSRSDLTASPAAERQSKVKSISIARNIYKKNAEEESEIANGEIVIEGETNAYSEVIYFDTPCYAEKSTGYDIEITSDFSDLFVVQKSEHQGAYYVVLSFGRLNGIMPKGSVIKYSIKGYQYEIENRTYSVQHNNNGENKSWDNPLINTEMQAKELEAWLASYLLGDVEYQIDWRGDPRADANDLFYLELKDRDDVTIRGYENELDFNGAWSGKISARKVVV